MEDQGKHYRGDNPELTVELTNETRINPASTLRGTATFMGFTGNSVEEGRIALSPAMTKPTCTLKV